MVGKSNYFDLKSWFFTVRVNWSETYEIETNASIVQVDSLQIQTSYLGNEYPSGYININGVRAVTFDGYYGTHSFYVGSAGTWVTLGGNPAAPWKSGSIAHNADGTKSITIEVSLSGTNMGSGWSVSGSQTIELTTIPRASTPTLSVASPYAGDTVTLYTNRKVSTYTHDITYTFGSASGTIGTNVGASIQWAIPISLAKAIAGTSGTLTIRTVTKSGSTTLGTSSITVTLRIPDNDTTKPVINSVVLTAEHDLPEKFSGVYVQGRSAIKAQVDAVGNYSDISGYSLTALGKAYAGNPAVTNALSITGSVSVKSTVTDKRGFSRSVTNEVLYYPYTKPGVAPPEGQSQITCKRCQADGTLDISGLYLKIDAGKKFSSVNGLNLCELRYRYSESGGAFTDWITLLEKGSADNYVSVVLEGVVDSAVTAYTVEIGVVDDISENSVTFPIGTASAVWHAEEGGEALGIGGYAQRKGVDVFWDLYMNQKKISGLPTPTEDSDAVPLSYLNEALGNVKVTMVTLRDLIFPVNSIYISYSHTSPASLFGGTWTRLSNRFLWATPSTGTIGGTGGESSHKLTINEMPAHSHTPSVGGSFYTTRGSGSSEIGGLQSGGAFGEAGSSGGASRTGYTSTVGGGAAHNNLPPWIAVSVWRRTA